MPTPLENPLPLQVGVCVVAAEALGVLAHVAALWAGLRRGQQVGRTAFVATQWGLETDGRGGRVSGLPEPGLPSPAPPLLLPVPSAGDCDHWAQGPGPGALHWSPLGRNRQPGESKRWGRSPRSYLALCLQLRTMRPGGNPTVCLLSSGAKTTHTLVRPTWDESKLSSGNQRGRHHRSMSKSEPFHQRNFG